MYMTISLMLFFGTSLTISRILLYFFWYLSALLGLFVPCQTPALRSILSKLVGEDERGGLFAVQSVAMSLGSLAYPLISTIYMGTLNSYPAAIYNVMAGVMVLALA